MDRTIGVGKRIIYTLMLPVIMYLVMMIFCYSNGKMYYGTVAMWRTLIVDIAISATCAFGIGLQWQAGRFDFSGGAIMLLSVIIAGNTAKNNGNSILLFVVLCFGLCVILSVGTSLLYVYGRLPVSISTITMALIYEAITPLVFNGSGVNLLANMTIRKVFTFPGALIPFAAATAVYWFYRTFTTSGKQTELLANNQQAAVNIGIAEKKNVIISYIFSGMIFGFGTMIYGGSAIKSASFTSLSTVSDLFTNILPVFIGLALSKYCGDTIGTLVGSVTLCLMTYGLKAVLSAEMGSALSMVFMGMFILIFNIITTPYGSRLTEWYQAYKRKKQAQA
ncbi:MAG: hypothetical protein LIP12_10490 [Clostridiales bacterium]|nr:hypothetical protein [Clostridiales bacterium]